MSIISGFDGEAVVEVSRRQRRDRVAPLEPVLTGGGLPSADELEPRQGDWVPVGLSSLGGVGGLLDRPPLLRALARRDPDLAESWTAHESTVERLRGVLQSLEQIQNDQRQEQRDYERAVLAATKKGTEPPKFTPRDWTATRRQLEAEQRALHAVASESRRAHFEAARASLPDVRAEVAGDLGRLHGDASEAWQAANVAIRAWLSSVWLLDQISSTMDGDADAISRRMSEDSRDLLAAGMAALGAIPALLGSECPVISGQRHLAPPDASGVPLHVRRAWWDSGSEHDMQKLRDLEASESWRGVSTYTRPAGGVPHSAV